MKFYIIILFLLGFVGTAHADSEDGLKSIYILESSWDGTQYVNPGETFWLKARIQPSENLHVKIFYFDDTIVQEKIYTPDEQGNVLVQYSSPDKEDSLSFYRIAMMVEGDQLKTAGEVFRIGDVYPTDLIRFLSVPNLPDAKIGDKIQIFSESNSRWDNPPAPYSKITLTLINPSGNVVYQNETSTNELGQFADEFVISEKGFYKLVLKDQKRQNVHVFPLNYDTRKTITAEGKDFEIAFGYNPDEGIEYAIHKLDFNQKDKTLTILFENPAARTVRGDIKIPHEFLDGNMTTVIDNKIRTEFTQHHILNYSLTYFLLEPGNHTVQIIGTSAIPEFGIWTSLIFLISALPIILFTKQKFRFSR